MKPTPCPRPSLGKQLAELVVTVLVFGGLVLVVAMVKVAADPPWAALLMPLPFAGTWLVHRGLKKRFFR